MKRFATVFVAVVLSCAGSTAAQDLIAERCAEQWPGDRRMQDACIEQQWRGARAFFEFNQAHPVGEPSDIQLRCLSQWKDAKGRPDFRMVVDCTKRQMDARR